MLGIENIASYAPLREVDMLEHAKELGVNSNFLKKNWCYKGFIFS